MNKSFQHASSLVCRGVLGSLGIVMCPALAAPPDAGSLLREELRRDQAPVPQAPSASDSGTVGPAGADNGAKIKLTAFRIVGLTVVPDAQAQAFLAASLDKPVSINGLHRIAEQFEQWLRKRGLFSARAYVPPQDFKDGVVEIRVLEGRVEGIDIKRAPGARLSEETLKAMLAGALPPGSALEQERLERGLLLLNDLPATSARAVLAPGKELGGSRVVVEAGHGAIVSGNAELDNSGNRFTGDWRLGAGVVLNDPYGLGDQWSLRAATSQGSTFLRAGYVVPLGVNGWKGGVSLIESRYRLCCDAAVTPLASSGEAAAFSGFVSYPLIRTRLNNLTASANWARRDFVNRSLGATTSDKQTETLTAGVSGDWSDMVGLSGLGGLGAYTTYGAQWVSGRIDLDRSPDKAQDANLAQTQGRFDKWSGQASHLLRVSKVASLYGGVSAQWASKNLDSSEKFVLGGPQGVRAYPTGEASGDEGWLVNLEWRQELERQWRVMAFVDHGEIRRYRNPSAALNAATPNLGNRYALSGVGATLVWMPTKMSQISATLASRLGKNPARDTTGRDSDSRPTREQLWLQASLGFW